VDFYTDKLGFEIVRSNEGNVAVTLGEERLMLEAAGTFYSADYNEAIRARLGAASPHALYVEVSDVESYYEKLQAAGVQVVDPLLPRPWGQLEFTVGPGRELADLLVDDIPAALKEQLHRLTLFFTAGERIRYLRREWRKTMCRRAGAAATGVSHFVIPSVRGNEVAGAHGPGTTWR
jgi:catechol 2,3-dioxygenase-like lactoylglutathione lyase family enzyme